MLKKSILVCFVCFVVSSSLFAYDEFTEKKYKTFDGKIFEIKENAILHEKVQKNVDLLLEELKKDIEEYQQQNADMIRNRTEYFYNCENYYLKELGEKKKLCGEFENCLYRCIKKLEEKGIEIEIKLIQHFGTFTVHRSSNLK